MPANATYDAENDYCRGGRCHRDSGTGELVSCDWHQTDEEPEEADGEGHYSGCVCVDCNTPKDYKLPRLSDDNTELCECCGEAKEPNERDCYRCMR